MRDDVARHSAKWQIKREIYLYKIIFYKARQVLDTLIRKYCRLEKYILYKYTHCKMHKISYTKLKFCSDIFHL